MSKKEVLTALLFVLRHKKTVSAICIKHADKITRSKRKTDKKFQNAEKNPEIY